MLRTALAFVAATLLAGCAARQGTARAPRSQELAAGSARFRIVYWPEDAAAAREVRRALELAVPRVARWGALRHPVTVTIHPTHEALEAAADRPGYGWLHAWARFDTIDLQSPRTWSFLGARRRELRELVTHELTHCAVYQLGGDELSWPHKDIPRWFSEGLASLTAGQGYRWGGLEELRELYARTPPPGGAVQGGAPGLTPASARPADPLADPDSLYQDRWHVVYGAAHRATELLLARHGEARVLEVLRLMGEGLRFGPAFLAAMGETEQEFAAEFGRYVASQE